MTLPVALLNVLFAEAKKKLKKTQHNTIEHSFLQALEKDDHSWDDEKRVFSCKNCGAETVLDKDKVADFCTFCGSSHISSSENHAGIKPALVLPFQVPKEEAIEKFKVWINKRYFAPSSLKKSYQLSKITGGRSSLLHSIRRPVQILSYESEPIIMLQSREPSLRTENLDK